MNIFAVFGADEIEPVANFIEEHYPSNFYKIKDGEWFVASNKTTNEITDFFLENLKPAHSTLEITFIIIPASNWNGWSKNHMWEWLTLKSKEILVTTQIKDDEINKETNPDV